MLQVCHRRRKASLPKYCRKLRWLNGFLFGSRLKEKTVANSASPALISGAAFLMKLEGPSARTKLYLRAQSAARSRRNKASSLVEVLAAIGALLPVLILVIFAITQVSQYFVLKQQLAYVARQAARELAYAYGTQNLTSMNSGSPNSGPANLNDPNYQKIVNAISVPGVIGANSSPQFSVYFNIPNSPALTKSYVTASVFYRNGPNLPTYPWNPLSKGLIALDLSGLRVSSSCSWPIPH